MEREDAASARRAVPFLARASACTFSLPLDDLPALLLVCRPFLWSRAAAAVLLPML